MVVNLRYLQNWFNFYWQSNLIDSNYHSYVFKNNPLTNFSVTFRAIYLWTVWANPWNNKVANEYILPNLNNRFICMYHNRVPLNLIV